MAAGAAAPPPFSTPTPRWAWTPRTRSERHRDPRGGRHDQVPPPSPPSAASFLSLGAASKALAKKNDDASTGAHETLSLVAEALAGLVFGMGLTVSGMRRAAKVSGFLSATATSFDPSLMLVMGGAMAVAIPGFQMVKSKKKPVCGKREFSIPKNKQAG